MCHLTFSHFFCIAPLFIWFGDPDEVECGLFTVALRFPLLNSMDKGKHRMIFLRACKDLKLSDIPKKLLLKMRYYKYPKNE